MDRLAEQLLPRRPAGDERPEDRILAYYLGIDEDAPIWPNAGEVAARVGTARSAVADALEAARDRWHKSADLNAVRAEIDTLLNAAGGVASVDELAAQLLAARGSVEDDERQRSMRARATIRAAVELEAAVSPIRFAAYLDPEGRSPLVAVSAEAAEYARRLARAADSLAKEDPLPSPGRVEEELGLVPVPEGASPLAADRRLRLAVAASKGAALSARGELYPRGMPALDRASPVSWRARRRRRLAGGRNPGPRAGPLSRSHRPFRRDPDLDAMLQEASADRIWRRAARRGSRLLRPHNFRHWHRTVAIVRIRPNAPAPEATPEVLDARAIEDKIVYAADRGIFLALTVEPRRARDAEAELLRRFPRERLALSA